METENDRTFNCAESVLIAVNREKSLPDYNLCCMKITSVLGGGIAGTGEVCGAITGALICLALLLGTYGNEPLEYFISKRSLVRETIKTLMDDFAHDWGSTHCRDLKAIDEGTYPKSGYRRNNESPRKRCDDYVIWAIQKTNEIRDNFLSE